MSTSEASAPPSRRSTASSRLHVLAAALLFSTGGVAIKLCALSSWQIAGFRSGIAALALWLLLPAWRRFWEPRVLVVGVAYAATLVLFVTANTLTTAANSIFLQGSAPLYVLALSPRLLGERHRRSDFVVAAILAVGLLAFFIGSEEPLRTAPDPARGNAVAATAGVTWAFALLGLRWLAHRPSAAGRDATGAAVVAGNLLAFACCLPFAVSAAPGAPVDWAIVAYLGLVQIGLAYVLLVRGVRNLRAIEISLLLILEPVLSTGWAWLVHGEVPGAWSLAGCSLILAGILTQALRPAE